MIATAPRSAGVAPAGFLILAISFLLVARSSLVPEQLAYSTPLIVSGMLLVGVLLYHRQFATRWELLFPIALTLILTISTGVYGNTFDTIKVFGIGLAWVLAMWYGLALDDRQIRLVIQALLIMVVVEFVIIFLETVAGVPWVRSTIAADTSGTYVVRPNTILGDWINRGQGTVGYPIPLGNFFIVGLGLALFFPGLLRRTRVIVGALALAGAVLTGTRTTLFAGAILVLVGAVVRFRRNLLTWIVAVILAVGLAVFFVGYLGQSDSSGDVSFTHRAGSLASAFDLQARGLLPVLFGSGYNVQVDRLASAGYFFSGSTAAADNTYVSILLSAGIVGMGVWVAAVIAVLVRGATWTRTVIIGFAAYLVAYDGLWWHLLAAVFWFMLGVGMKRAIYADDGRSMVEPALVPRASTIRTTTRGERNE